MARHVVRALVSVDEDLAVVVRDDVVERSRHVCTDVWVAVLVEGDGGGGVLQKEVDGTDRVVLKGGEVADDLVGDEVAAPCPGREGESLLVPACGHCRCRWVLLLCRKSWRRERERERGRGDRSGRERPGREEEKGLGEGGKGRGWR